MNNFSICPFNPSFLDPSEELKFCDKIAHPKIGAIFREIQKITITGQRPQKEITTGT